MDRFSDNDLIQEYFEGLVSARSEDFRPAFLLDDDFTVIWANDAAYKRFPAFAEPDGIAGFLRDYEEEKERLVSENVSAEIDLGASGCILRIDGHAIGSGFRIYEGVITDRVDLISMTDEEAGRYLAQRDTDLRRAMMPHLLRMGLHRDEFAEDPETQQMYDRAVWEILQGYRQFRLFYTGQSLSRGMLRHTYRRLDLSTLICKVFSYAENLINVLAGSEMLYNMPTVRMTADIEPDHILAVLAQLISNAVKYRTGCTPIQAILNLREHNAEILIINEKAECGPASIEYRAGLATAAGLAEFIGGSLTYRLDKYRTAFRFTIPLRQVKRQADAKQWTIEDEAEMRARFCIDLCDAPPTQYELIMMF